MYGINSECAFLLNLISIECIFFIIIIATTLEEIIFANSPAWTRENFLENTLVGLDRRSLTVSFPKFSEKHFWKKNLWASTMLQVKLLRFVDNVRLSVFMHKITGTHFDEFAYEYSVFKFPLSLSKCKTLPVFKRLLIELEPLIADYSRSV